MACHLGECGRSNLIYDGLPCREALGPAALDHPVKLVLRFLTSFFKGAVVASHAIPIIHDCKGLRGFGSGREVILCEGRCLRIQSPY